MERKNSRALIEAIRAVETYGELGRSELIGLAFLATDALEDSLDEVDRLRECFVTLQYLSDHPGYPGFINHSDLKEILDDYLEMEN